MIVVFVSAMNILDKQFTLNNQREKTNCEVLNVAQVDNLIDVDPQLIWFAELRNQDSFEGELNQLFEEFDFQKSETLTGCPAPDYSKLSFQFQRRVMISLNCYLCKETFLIKFWNFSE